MNEPMIDVIKTNIEKIWQIFLLDLVFIGDVKANCCPGHVSGHYRGRGLNFRSLLFWLEPPISGSSSNLSHVYLEYKA